MGKRGPAPKGKVQIKWSPSFAYAIGLITTDGNLSSDKRHISFTSKDLLLAKNFCTALKIPCKISQKARARGQEKIYYVVQFSDVVFYQFLVSIGLMPRKSKVMKEIKIPDAYARDFLRGHFDGDGTLYAYVDKRWKNSYMFYTAFVSASEEHILWIRDLIRRRLGAKGHISKAKRSSVYQLRFGKGESLKIFKNMYYGREVICLTRKYRKFSSFLRKK
ncbi:MAG TPA: LAGLIDADG family homing endonuclease [Candidatus Paceibacterota bacterium]|nr:LAGLIDADG family homing endonuclease [Candidatus Paceibacterota bacterium]